MAEMIQPAMVPKVKLYTGEEIPCVGMGTFGSDRFTPEQVSNAVASAAAALREETGFFVKEDMERIFKEVKITKLK